MHPGETLTKEHHLQTGWPNTFICDDVLVRSISEIRRAFEDDADNSKLIQTIRLVATRPSLVSTAVIKT
jgi:DNA-binding winged helix-turn-helix (wHTH) protein